jgi:4-diphosphocytidyl-2-C-methyl-D-erythritol kinase
MDDPRVLSASARHVAGVAPAKLNLFLEVLGRRPDGYHELRTVFHEIDLADDLRVETKREGADSLECRGLPIDGPPEKNLALRAAAAFRALVHDAPPIHVELVKKTPLGSGMGGGSSDAAFVLRALRLLVDPTIQDERLAVAARTVGADVAFFLRGGSAVGRGRGDELEAVADCAPYVFLLALPDFALSTTRVYEHVDLIAPRVDVSSFVEGMGRGVQGTPVAGCFNRLEAAAVSIAPELRPLLVGLRDSTGLAWTMTGSGSALFAPMRSAADAEALARRVTGSIPLHLRIVRSFGTPAAIERPAPTG